MAYGGFRYLHLCFVSINYRFHPKNTNNSLIWPYLLPKTAICKLDFWSYSITPLFFLVSYSWRGLKMKIRNITMIGTLSVLIFMFSPAHGIENSLPADKSVPGEIIIGFTPQVGVAQANNVISSIGGKLVKQYFPAERTNQPCASPKSFSEMV